MKWPSWVGRLGDGGLAWEGLGVEATTLVALEEITVGVEGIDLLAALFKQLRLTQSGAGRVM